MDDLISRQAAIEVADAVWIVTGDTNVAKVWQQLQDLPSAQKKGHWIDKEICFTCSECVHDSIEGGNFCPYCGADMRGDVDG